MKKLFRILSLILLIIFILPYGYSSEIIKLKNIKSDKPIYKPTINEILKLINEEKDMEYWYGIYSNNEKFGWMNLRSNLYRSDKFKEDVLEMVAEMDFISKELGNDGKSVTSHFNVLFTDIYQSKAPFRIIESHQAIQIDDMSTSSFGEKQGHNFKIVYKVNKNNVRELLLTNFNYSLYDLLAIDAWFRKKPRKINDVVASITFDFESLEYILNETSIIEIINKKVSGVDYVYYKVNSLDKADISDENFSFQFLFDSKGKPIQFFIGGLELRLESKKNAKKLDKISDIFVNLGLNIENSFPKNFYDKHANMIVYEIIGDDSSINKKGHQKFKILDNEIKILTVGTNVNQNPFSMMENVTTEQREYYLKSTSMYPHKSKIIVNILKQALQNEKEDIEKIYKLAKFVHDYIEDDYESNSVSVFDVIKRKKGDCTEHTQLFVSLARAAGFPTREVGGWVYDGADKFMPHAWAEVAIKANNDFFWLPVDPTWNIINPTNVIKETNEKIISDKFTLSLRRIIYEDGEIIEFKN